jgi:RNase H
LSDSQAALKALGSWTCESKLTWDCRQSLKQLASNNRVKLVWVPGHQGIEGNEIADQLAKEGVMAPLTGPEPYCGLSKSHIMADVQKWERAQKMTRWNNIQGLRQAKLFIKYSPKYTKQLLELSRRELRMVTGLLTGHCPLRYHLKKMDLVENDICRFCQHEQETAEHVLCTCAALDRTRLKYIGKVNPLPSDIPRNNPITIALFARSINIWE